MASPVAKETGSFMVQVKPSTLPVPNPVQRRFSIAQLMLRVLSILSALAAIVVIVTSKQSVVVFGISLDARFYYSSAFKFFVVANSIACAFSSVSLILNCFYCPVGSNHRNNFIILVHDMVIMVLIISGCAAATAIGYVGRYGQSQIGWMGICNNVGKFCNKVLASIVLSFSAFFSLFVLTIITAHQLKSRDNE